MDRALLHLVYAFGGYGILLYILVTTLIAGLLSFLIGLERQLRGEAAGIRTHALLSIGCSLLMTISVWAIRIADGSIEIAHGAMQEIDTSLNYDTSRIAAAVVTGIGFLGGGVIIKDKFDVKGLATAGKLWICAAIGLCCGAGFVMEAVIATAVTIFTLLLLGRLLAVIDSKCPSVTVHAKAGYPVVERMRDFAERNGMVFRFANIFACDDGGTKARITFAYRTDPMMLRYLCEQFSEDENILSAEPTKKTPKTGKE